MPRRDDIRKDAAGFMDEKRRAVAYDLADGTLTLQQIAKKHGVHEATVRNWRKVPEFQRYVKQLVDDLDQIVFNELLAVKRNRLRALQDKHDRLMRIVHERGVWYEEQDPDTPGGGSGLLVGHVKSIGSGQFAYERWEHEADVALSKELREIEKQIAQELGQWSDKTELSGRVDGPAAVIKFLPQKPRDDE